MNNRLFISDPITCNARSELYITDVSMQTQTCNHFAARSQTFLSVFMPTHNTYFCFIVAVKVAQDVKDVLADFVRHGNLSYA